MNKWLYQMAVFVTGCFGFLGVVNAEEAWKLVQKEAGPSQWECPLEVRLRESGGDLSVERAPMGSQLYYSLDQGKQCSWTNSSEIVRRKRCYLNQSAEIGSQTVITNQICVGTFFGSFVESVVGGAIEMNCDPSQSEISQSIEIDHERKTLRTYEVINWGEDRTFSCIYRQE